jgi:multiple sugar transport system ATP-binding protein
MQLELRALHRRLGATFVYVTHDQTEAMTLGDRVAVMKKGVLQQVAPPQELYDYPVNLFVAGFIGSPAMNMIKARLDRTPDEKFRFDLGRQHLDVPASLLEARPALRGWVGRDVVVGIRPEDMEDSALVGTAEGRTLTGRAELVEAMGSEVLIHVRIDAPPVVTEDTVELAADTGAAGEILVNEHTLGTSIAVARVSPRTGIREGDSPVLVVDTERIHVFDPETGSSIWGDRGATHQTQTQTHTEEGR